MINCDRRSFVKLCAAGAAFPELPRAAPASGLLVNKGLGPVTTAERYLASAAAAGPDDWKQFSTVYFTYPAFAQKTSAGQIKGKVHDAVSSGSQVLMFFVIHEGYALYKSDVVERYPYAVDFDVLAEVAAEAKASGLKFVACWMGMYGVGLQVEEHPGWLRVSSDGKRKDDLAGNSMCLRSPFQYFLLQQVKEVITRYPVDGIYFDGLCQLRGYCYCQYCRSEFQARYGRDLPKDPDEPTFFKFRLDATTEIIRAIRAAIDELAPSVLLFFNIFGIESYYNVGHDLVRLGPYTDVFTLGSLWELTGVPIWKVGMQKQLVAVEAKKPVWYPRWIARNPDNDLACVPAATIKVWAGESMNNAESPVAVEQNVFDVDRSQSPTLQECFGRVKEIVPYLREGRRLCNVALLHSITTKEFVYPRKNEHAYMDNLEGMNSALLNQHLPFEFVTERDVEAGLDKQRFKALILANAMCLGDATVKAIGDFVNASGGLLATYRSSMLNEKGDERDEMGLAPILGIGTMGLVVRPGGTVKVLCKKMQDEGGRSSLGALPPDPQDLALWCKDGYANVYGKLTGLGMDALGESALAQLPGLFLSVSMLDWQTGAPDARYWALKLVHEHFGPGDKLVATTATMNSPVYAQAFITRDGSHKLLLVNKREQPSQISLKGLSTASEEFLDETTGSKPPAKAHISDGSLTLGGLGVAVVTAEP